MEKSAEGVVGGDLTEGPNDGGCRIMVKDSGQAPENLQLPLMDARGESEVGASRVSTSTQTQAKLSQVLDRENMLRALKRVRQNAGAPGVSQRMDRGDCHKPQRWQWLYPLHTSINWDCRALWLEWSWFHRIAGYVIRMSGGVGGRSREASSYPD